MLVPYDGGFPLVGDADGGDLLGFDAALGNGFHHDGILAGIDLHGVLFHPARLRIELGKFLLGHLDDVLGLIEENGPAGGSALIQGQDVTLHRAAPFKVNGSSGEVPLVTLDTILDHGPGLFRALDVVDLDLPGLQGLIDREEMLHFRENVLG